MNETLCGETRKVYRVRWQFSSRYCHNRVLHQINQTFVANRIGQNSGRNINFLSFFLCRGLPTFIMRTPIRKSGLCVYTRPCRLLYSAADYKRQTITANFPREISDKLQLQRHTNPSVNTADNFSLLAISFCYYWKLKKGWISYLRVKKRDILYRIVKTEHKTIYQRLMQPKNHATLAIFLSDIVYVGPLGSVCHQIPI